MDWTCSFQEGNSPETWDGCDEPATMLDIEDGKHYCQGHADDNHELVIIAAVA